MRSEVTRQKKHSQNILSVTILLLSLIGAGVSAYLTYIHLKWVEPVCVSGMDCNGVLFSPYAEIFTIPMAAFGLLLYCCMIAGSTLLFSRRGQFALLGSLGIFTLSLSGALFSLYLLYLEAFKIHAFCSWCIGSAVVIFCIFILISLDLRLKKIKIDGRNHFTP